MVYFTSDTHFNNKFVFERERKFFKTVEKMNNYIIYTWNNLVAPEDIVYHLGDFGGYDDKFEYIKKLNGKVILVMGNAEEQFLANYYNNNFDTFKKYLLELGFFNVIKSEGFEIEAKHIYGDFLYLVHKPINCVKDMFNLFGHVHKLYVAKDFGINVGVDCHNFCPLSLENIIRFQLKYKNENNLFVGKEILYTLKEKKRNGNLEQTEILKLKYNINNKI